MSKQSFFDPTTERYTAEGQRDAVDIEEAIARIVYQWKDKYSARELEYVINQSACMQCLAQII